MITSSAGPLPCCPAAACDVRAIQAGPGFIHQVWHIARPTVSMAVRTESEADVPAQHQYWPRRVSLAFTLWDPILDKRIEMMKFLFRMDRPGKDRFAREIILDARPVHAFHCLLEYLALSKDPGRLDELMGPMVEKHGSWLSHVGEASDPPI